MLAQLSRSIPIMPIMPIMPIPVEFWKQVEALLAMVASGQEQ